MVVYKYRYTTLRLWYEKFPLETGQKKRYYKIEYSINFMNYKEEYFMYNIRWK